MIVWQWSQLRTMKVGGNESATKFFQSHGGSAALASKDAKVKYTSNAANKYKEELKRRAERDAQEYPDEVVITDDPLSTPGADGTSTPAGEPADDFFSSWDKPTIKRPSNPPSRSGTPPVISRTASPFLSAGNATNGSQTRPKSPSPLAANTANDAVKDAEAALPAPAAIRTTSSSAIRKGPNAAGGAGARRANVLSGKKPAHKLGAKKVVGEEIDFEAAEKAAKAEAERIEKLGYDPEAEKAEELAKASKSSNFGASSAATPKETPTPINTATRAASNPSHARSPSELERLGMGMGRLGFGQVGPTKGAASSSAAAPKKLGFGAVGHSKPSAADGKDIRKNKPDHPLSASLLVTSCPTLLLFLLYRRLTISFLITPIQTRKNNTPAANSAARSRSRPTSSLAATATTRRRKPRRNRACKPSRVPRRSVPTRISDVPRMILPVSRAATARTETLRRWPRTSSENSA
ncbi:hypothetical protein CLAIMM_06945 isoform 1 [Cladophialophora immunda]|nr:hypothetical protein CLAIMM_06945 isoform 1 [Cladophialophora immunda]